MTQWQVNFTDATYKKLEDMPEQIKHKIIALAKSMEVSGPIQHQRPNFSKLKSKNRKTYHCHLKKGKPTYVAIWTVTAKQITIEYIGTHENAPY